MGAGLLVLSQLITCTHLVYILVLIKRHKIKIDVLVLYAYTTLFKFYFTFWWTVWLYSQWLKIDEMGKHVHLRNTKQVQCEILP